MNKWFSKMVKTTIAASTLGMAAVGTAESVDAQINTSVVDEAWGKPTFVYGGGLSEAQISETADLFGIDDRANVEEMPATGEDLQTYLGYGSGSTSSMISSVLVQREGEGEGVEVMVETPENITKITEEQYMNAAITAGVEDATIMVGSIRPVTGESALTGVYKAFDANGETLEKERMEVAQQELETTSDISEELDEEQSVQLDQAMVDIKRELAELKEQVGELATREDIERIINEALEKNSLQNIVSQEQVNQLVILFENYQQTSAIDSQAVKAQLENLAGDLQDRLGAAWQSAEESGLTDRIAQFFSELWQTLVGLFN
ncbi:DUF1002 domain-containing protein [Atopococcus tabaci]|uniref:DUF1002 domain-containing protein n=1 Tax=Atopococcus tabaci TaxID=269774 RepID=UPI000401496B|nr:DUF1002 domain-containing protein [Atopococcus tabaci]